MDEYLSNWRRVVSGEFFVTGVFIAVISKVEYFITQKQLSKKGIIIIIWMKSTKYHGTIKGKIDTNVQKPVVFVNFYHISLKVFSDKKKD